MTRDPNLNLTTEQWRKSLPRYTVPVPVPVVIRLEKKS